MERVFIPYHSLLAFKRRKDSKSEYDLSDPDEDHRNISLHLKELESETFLKISGASLSFLLLTTFVKEWQEEGGNEIIQEMIQERKA